MLHVDIPTRADIEWLAETRHAVCLSIYLPTTPVTPDSDHDRLVLKNLAKDGLDGLRAGGADREAVSFVEEALDDLVDDDEFWAHQANSLAVFATADHVATFRLANRLEGRLQTADRFFLKPLLRSITAPQSAFVLALAQGSVSLVEVSPDLPAFTVAVDMPSDVASAAGKASITDRSHSGRIHGSEGQKVRMRQYARQVDQALRELLAGRETPLILAAAPPLDAIYRSVNSYPFLADVGIAGNPEKMSDAELAQEARDVLDRLFREELAEIDALFELRTSQGRTTTDVAEAARAATYGAVAILLVDIDAVVPGVVDDEDGTVSFADEGDAGAYGVVDEVARRALATGARVLGVRRDEVPGGGDLAAILRYRI
jgi:hypothetical protein